MGDIIKEAFSETFINAGIRYMRSSSIDDITFRLKVELLGFRIRVFRALI